MQLIHLMAVVRLNKRQEEVQNSQLRSEKKTINELKQVYKKAREDCEQKILELSARSDSQNMQSIVYQKQYQEAIKKQLDTIINTLETNQFDTVSDYLVKSYENGYIGVMYDLQGQGIPLTIPIDQEQVVKALETDSKISTSLYTRLGEDTKRLKNSIRAELSRGIVQGVGFSEIASHIANGMNSPFNRAYNNAIRIARTEGHRVQNESSYHAQLKAKVKGADVVKQWDATMDMLTRPEHKELDGQIVEVEEDFEIGGYTAKYCGDFGIPTLDINCRCQILQRAKWMLDSDELQYLKDKSKFFGLDKTNDFEDFKKKYLNLPKNADTINVSDVLDTNYEVKDEKIKKLVSDLKKLGVEYNPVKNHTNILTQDEIIKRIAGGDRTGGSCASLGLAYIGQKLGWDVLDFRGGESRSFFASCGNLLRLSENSGLSIVHETGACSLTVGNRLLKHVEEGKEYYLCVGRHASIVRKVDGKLQYLELQNENTSGWIDFNGNARYTLGTRFGCTNTSKFSRVSQKFNFLLNIDDSTFDDDFKYLLGYLNTDKDSQLKGVGGFAK